MSLSETGMTSGVVEFDIAKAGNYRIVVRAGRPRVDCSLFHGPVRR